LPFDLSLVIPAHNEADRIESGFARLEPVLASLAGTKIEIVIVDDGSTDETSKVAIATYASRPDVRIRRLETNRGKGAAVRVGLALATGDKVVVCDTDMAISPKHLPAMMEALDRAPVAIGSRADHGAIRYRSRVRTVTGSVFNAVVRRTIDSNVRDTQCGFKGFQLGAGRLLANCGLVQGFAYDVEVLYLATQLGLAVEPVPVTWDDVAGSSVRIVHDSRRMLHDIRSLRATTYECLAVRANRDVDLDKVRDAAVASRQGSLVAALGDDALVALPREGALAGTTIASAVSGSLAAVPIAMFAHRELVPL
jgi:dolichyl-phosphate beta-glucosyltransferase